VKLGERREACSDMVPGVRRGERRICSPSQLLKMCDVPIPIPAPMPILSPPLRSLVRVLVRLGVFMPSSDGDGRANEMLGEWLCKLAVKPGEGEPNDVNGEGDMFLGDRRDDEPRYGDASYGFDSA
jgi:hypothetical protein